MDRGGPRHYRMLAEILAMGFAADADPTAKAVAAGRAWGHRAESEGESGPEPAASSAEEAIEVVECSTTWDAPEVGHPTRANRSACATARS